MSKSNNGRSISYEAQKGAQAIERCDAYMSVKCRDM